MSLKTVVVVGASGLQGSSVVAEFLKYPNDYRVRGLTRDPSKPAALALSANGVDVQAADPNAEIAQGKALADAAATIPSLEHFVWSALPDPMEVSQGRFYHVHHWKSKADVTDYIKAKKPDLWKKTATVLFPNYFENCLTYPTEDWRLNHFLAKVSGKLIREFPLSSKTNLPNVAISDTGKLVYAVVENRKSYLEKAIAFYAQALSEGEKLAQLSKELGVTFEYRKSTFGQFQKRLEDAGMIPELALDFTEQLLIFEYFGNIYASHDFVQATEIPGLSLKTWEEFIQENKEELRSKIASANAPSPWGLRLAEEP
ncbi:NAD(P)-binding protein [Trichoderma asperelloides]|nr:NAD(P)-binding protein [Trichoderma asperelloides]